ncbi:MAG: hypothetical protein IKL44_03780 [Clostridia bacterium]|nr:hypothetical protein [Clostridia bacterium]
MKKFYCKNQEIVWVENFNSSSTFIVVYYKGKKYKRNISIFGEGLFPADTEAKRYLKTTLGIDVPIPPFSKTKNNNSAYYIRKTKAKRSNVKTNYANYKGSVSSPSFFISPNGTCLKEMDWDFD